MSQTPPSIDFLDHGFLFGDSLYEVVRLYEGRIFAWSEHLMRLQSSAKALELDLDPILPVLQQRVKALFQALKSPDAVCRMIVTRGVGPLHIDPRPCREPRLYLAAWPFSPNSLAPIKIAIPPMRRNHHLSLSPAVKSGNYLNNVVGLKQALDAGADDALFLNPDGELTELSTSNLAWVREGVFETPALDCGILNGITRQYFLKSSIVSEVKVKEDILKSVDEVFALSTLKEILPVKQIRFSDGSSREFTQFAAASDAHEKLRVLIDESLKTQENLL